MLHATPRMAFAIPLPKRFPKGMRQHLEQAIERHQAAMEGLIALLDIFDGDPDLEPALGFQRLGYRDTDLEAGDIQDEPHDPDPDEYSLGWLGWVNQEAALASSQGAVTLSGGDPRHYAERNSDMEGEHDGREHSWTETHGKGGVAAGGSEYDEAALGWLGWANQEKALRRSRGADLEAEHDGREPEHEGGWEEARGAI